MIKDAMYRNYPFKHAIQLTTQTLRYKKLTKILLVIKAVKTQPISHKSYKMGALTLSYKHLHSCMGTNNYIELDDRRLLIYNTKEHLKTKDLVFYN